MKYIGSCLFFLVLFFCLFFLFFCVCFLFFFVQNLKRAAFFVNYTLIFEFSVTSCVVLSMGGEGELPKRFNGVSDACLPVDSKWHRLFLFACWMHGLRDSNGNFRSDLSADSWDWAHQHLLPIYYCRRYPHAEF